MRIILASQSPRRKKLLHQLGFRFEIIPSSVVEESEESDPKEFVKELAFKKASQIASLNPDSLVIGSDTIVVLENKILGKPTDNSEAFEMLSSLSGAQHFVYTGVSLIETNQKAEQIKKVIFCTSTKVTFSALDPGEIRRYIQTGSCLDKAGSYGIQDDWGATFVESIEGDFYNVVGLPLNRLYFELKSHFPETLNEISISV